jgi:hypothetical protein
MNCAGREAHQDATGIVIEVAGPNHEPSLLRSREGSGDAGASDCVHIVEMRLFAGTVPAL